MRKPTELYLKMPRDLPHANLKDTTLLTLSNLLNDRVLRTMIINRAFDIVVVRDELGGEDKGAWVFCGQAVHDCAVENEIQPRMEGRLKTRNTAIIRAGFRDSGPSQILRFMPAWLAMRLKPNSLIDQKISVWGKYQQYRNASESEALEAVRQVPFETPNYPQQVVDRLHREQSNSLQAVATRMLSPTNLDNQIYLTLAKKKGTIMATLKALLKNPVTIETLKERHPLPWKANAQSLEDKFGRTIDLTEFNESEALSDLVTALGGKVVVADDENKVETVTIQQTK